LFTLVLFSSTSRDHLHLHSFPTRRSSDLRRQSIRTPSRSEHRRPARGRGRPRRPGRVRPHSRIAFGTREGPDERDAVEAAGVGRDRKSTRLNSSHVKISYAVFCLKKKII